MTDISVLHALLCFPRVTDNLKDRLCAVQKGQSMVLRKEIRDFSRACEHLLAMASSTDTESLTSDELQMIHYYAHELIKLPRRQ